MLDEEENLSDFVLDFYDASEKIELLCQSLIIILAYILINFPQFYRTKMKDNSRIYTFFIFLFYFFRELSFFQSIFLYNNLGI